MTGVRKPSSGRVQDKRVESARIDTKRKVDRAATASNSRATKPNNPGLYPKQKALRVGPDFQATKGGKGRGVWKSPSGTNLSTAAREDAIPRNIKPTRKKPV